MAAGDGLREVFVGVHIPSYSSIFAMGHKATVDMFNVPVLVEEKIDGSQMSWMKDEAGEVHFRSKGAVIYQGAVQKLFQPAVDHILSVKDHLKPGVIYRGEVVSKPKHNVLAYDRAPRGYVVLFDVDIGLENYVDAPAKDVCADCLGLEVPQVLALWTERPTMEAMLALLTTPSMLGGQLIEGFVMKAYGLYGPDKKTLMAKYVSERFKEVHKRSFKADGDKGDIFDQLEAAFRTEARWEKAVQHLRDAGTLVGSPRDIGPLLKEVAEDVEREEAEAVKEKLWQWARKMFLRKVTGGLPEWYKKKLLESVAEPPKPPETPKSPLEAGV